MHRLPAIWEYNPAISSPLRTGFKKRSISPAGSSTEVAYSTRFFLKMPGAADWLAHTLMDG
jgi:hypothetical protein